INSNNNSINSNNNSISSSYSSISNLDDTKKKYVNSTFINKNNYDSKFRLIKHIKKRSILFKYNSHSYSKKKKKINKHNEHLFAKKNNHIYKLKVNNLQYKKINNLFVLKRYFRKLRNKQDNNKKNSTFGKNDLSNILVSQTGDKVIDKSCNNTESKKNENTNDICTNDDVNLIYMYDNDNNDNNDNNEKTYTLDKLKEEKAERVIEQSNDQTVKSDE
ncbi:hypothetical protein HEP_00025000, partial [Hepatocystis sp. ex Piliocolobus tephrosceles]